MRSSDLPSYNNGYGAYSDRNASADPEFYIDDIPLEELISNIAFFPQADLYYVYQNADTQWENSIR